MKVHFIAIGGSAMHNLAIALAKKGYEVTGSDDEIFEPSRSRLHDAGLLPSKWGWFPEKINKNIDAVILGMHAKEDNPELEKALNLGLKVYSYPEYLYTQTENKMRVVVGGSHGKTTVTSMIMHVLKQNKIDFDYMVGAQFEGFDTMVNLTKNNEVAIFEGDEYLSSPLDKKPKFLWYKPQIAVLTGVAWDHINVFPTYKEYKKQFELFVESIEDGGTLIYNQNDPVLKIIAKKHAKRLNLKPYEAIQSHMEANKTIVEYHGKFHMLQVFGQHNLENIQAAKFVCAELGVSGTHFLRDISTFSGASRRLQLLKEEKDFTVFYDFAHSPSKLKATTNAVKSQFEDRKLVACMELHTFSSLNKDFLPQYKKCMDKADLAYVYYNTEVIKHKNMENFSDKDVLKAFAHKNMKVFTDSNTLLDALRKQKWEDSNLLIMTSGNFDGKDIKEFVSTLK